MNPTDPLPLEWKITVPELTYASIDIKEIKVIPVDRLSYLNDIRLIDNSFAPKIENIDKTNILSPLHYNNRLLSRSMYHKTNLVAYNFDPKDPEHIFLRINETKRAGSEYPGVGVGIIIPNDNGQIVMTKRSGTSNNRLGFWDLPGGTVEFGDTLEDTVKKEALEETSLIVKPLRCLGVWEDDRIETGNQHWISFGYLAKHIAGKLKNNEPYKFSDVKYVNPDNLPKDTSRLAKDVMKKWKTRPIIQVYNP